MSTWNANKPEDPADAPNEAAGNDASSTNHAVGDAPKPTGSQKFLLRVPLVVNGGDGTPTDLTMVLSTAERPVVFSEQVIVYADEQGGSSAKRSDEFAIGLEFGPGPMPEAIIAKALAARTCADGCRKSPFFHARIDCPACRQLLAETIRTQLQDRFFISLRWKHAEAKPGQPKGAELHQHALALALGFISSITNVRHVVVKFERIQGLSADALKRWFRRDAEARVNTIVKYGIPLSVVPIDFEPASKEEPGVQVCDHLLWAERRARREGDTAPWERLGMNFDHSQEHGPYSIVFYSRVDGAFPHHFQRPKARDPGDLPWEQVAHMIYSIEAAIHDLAKTKPSDLRHLEHLLGNASARTRGRRRIAFEAWQELHRAYLAFADLYMKQTDLTDEHRQAASDAAALSRIICDGRETRAISMFSAWQQIRAKRIDASDPKLT